MSCIFLQIKNYVQVAFADKVLLNKAACGGFWGEESVWGQRCGVMTHWSPKKIVLEGDLKAAVVKMPVDFLYDLYT